MASEGSVPKALDRGSAADLPAQQVVETIDMEGADDIDDNFPVRHGLTVNDKKDMSRMGKAQELRVSAV
jgi:hypothetical protein